MSLDFFSKVGIPAAAMGAAALLQLPAVWKGLEEVRNLRKDRRKKEADFANKVFEQTGDVHVGAYARDLSYAALVGDDHLNQAERKLLLSMPDAERVIDAYLKSFFFIKVFALEQQIGWRAERYSKKYYRVFLRVLYLARYFIFGMLAGLPLESRNLYDPNQVFPVSIMIFLVTIFAITNLPFAVISMRRFLLINIAADLIDKCKTHQAR